MKFYFYEKHRRKSGLCHNCDNILAERDNFCSICGQENHDLKVPIPHILEEVVEGVSHFDNKFFTTLKSLFLKPGQITKDFLDGKRTRFVPPLRLFFFISASYFFLDSCTQSKNNKHLKDPVWIAQRITELDVLSRLAQLEVRKFDFDTLRKMIPTKSVLEQKKILYALYKATLADTAHTYPIKASVLSRAYYKKLHQDLKLPVPDTILLRAIKLDEKVKIKLSPNKDYWVVGEGITKKIAATYLTYNDRQLDSVYLATEHKTITWFDRMFLKLTRQNTYNEVIAAEKDEDYKRTVINKGLNYTVVCMIPIVAFLLLLLFKKSRAYYYEHLIFSINYHSLLFIIIGIPLYLYLPFDIQFGDLVGGYTETVLFGGMWIYFLISAKNVFGQTWPRTSIKAIAFGLLYALFFVIFLVPIRMAVVSMFVSS
jgi:hypothetical protein